MVQSNTRGVSRKLNRGVLNYRRALARAIFGHVPFFRDSALYFTRGCQGGCNVKCKKPNYRISSNTINFSCLPYSNTKQG